MPYNGAGTFTSLGVPTFPAVTGDYILASYFNATMNDVFLGLSTALPRDGQAAMSANLPMGAFKITGLGDGSNPQDAVTFSQVFTSPTFANPTFTGTPVAPTPGTNINTTQIPTTAWVNIYYAPLASPALTGIPTAPTAAYGTDTDQLATMAALKDAIDLLPSGALPSVTGKDTTWKLQVNSGGTGVEWGQLVLNGVGGQVITGNTTLTVTGGAIPNAAISVTPTAPGLYATLPVATTITTEGVTQISVYNAGDYDYGVKDSAGTQLGWVRPRTGAIIGLADNSTAAGVWTLYGLEKTGVTAQYVNTTVSTSGAKTQRIALDANRTCFLFGGTTCYAIVYDDSAKTWGTATSVRASIPNSAFVGVLAGTDKVVVITCDSTTAGQACALTFTGTTVTVNTAYNWTPSANYAAFGTMVAVGTGFAFSYALAGPVSAERGVSVTGTIVSVGAEVAAANPLANTAPWLFVSGSTVRMLSPSATSLYCKPATLSGNTLTAGTQASVTTTDSSLRAFLNANGNIVSEYINTTHFAAVFALTGTTEAASAVSLGVTPVAIARDRTDCKAITASKTLFTWHDLSGSAYFRILTDTAGTASVGTLLTVTSDGSNSGISAGQLDGTTAYVYVQSSQARSVYGIDCSGTAAAVSTMRSMGYLAAGTFTPKASDFYAVPSFTQVGAGKSTHHFGGGTYNFDLQFGAEGIRYLMQLPVFGYPSNGGVAGTNASEAYLAYALANSTTGFYITKVEAAA